MYYMLNQERQIVAADYELLEILEIDNLPILFSKVVNNDIKITKISDRKLTIISDVSTIQSAYEEYTIKTTFGDIILVKLYNTVSKSKANDKKDDIKSVNKLNILLDDEPKKPKKKIPSIFFDDDDDEVITKPIKKTPIIEEKKSQLEQDLEEASQELQNPKTTMAKLEPSVETIEPKEELFEDTLSKLLEDNKEEEELEESNELLLDIEEPTPQEELKIDDIEEEEVEIEESNEFLLDIEEPTPQEELKIDDIEEEEEEEVEEIDDLLLDLEEPAPKKEGPKVEEEEVEEIDDLLLDVEKPISTPQKEEVKEEVEEIKDLLLDIDEDKVSPKEEPKVEEEEVEEIDDLLLDLEEPAPKKEEPKVEEEEIEDIDDLLLDVEKPISTPQKEELKEEVEEIKDLLLDIDEDKVSPKEEPKVEKKIEKKIEKKPIKDYNCDDTIEINIDDRSEDMGISATDYQDFLNEFIDKSIICDEDLRSEDKSAREEALEELQSIAESLEIANLEEILVDMQERDYLEEELVDIYFECLGQITTVSNEKPQEIEEPIEKKVEEKIEPKEEEPQGFGTLELDGIKPIHFDFRLEEAADDLSLPVDLIEEFVNDFVDQAVEEKETFIKAFAEGDIDTIQKTGHKLKGASSNLRIIPLSETLEEIQHCENPARFEPLLKKYWGQFLSFKLFMENIAH